MRITDKEFIVTLAILLAIQLPIEGFLLILLPIFLRDYLR